jgi:NADP-dependent 3-hydroxy acid dehydrogenase YdfG
MSIVVSALIAALAAQSGQTHERWAVITGASSGIGSAIALEASRRGYSVILAARRQDKLREVADDAIQAGAPAALIVQCDLGTNAGRNKLIAATRSHPPSMAVINAGFAYGGNFVKQDPKSVDEMVALNVGSMAALTRHYAETMMLQGGGRILLTGSIAGVPAGVLAACRSSAHFARPPAAPRPSPHRPASPSHRPGPPLTAPPPPLTAPPSIRRRAQCSAVRRD